MGEIAERAAQERHFQVNIKITEVLIPTCAAAVKKANSISAGDVSIRGAAFLGVCCLGQECRAALLSVSLTGNSHP